ncbi:MAG: YqaA family protein [Psychromonas sp.]
MYSELFVLLVSSLVSATLFPGGSELLLIYYIKNNPHNLWWYFTAATLGNSLGAIITYFLAGYLYWGREQARQKHLKTWHFCQKYGVWALLLSWVPVVGDFIPLAAGWLKTPQLLSITLITAGKALRYGVIIISTVFLI